MWRISEKSKFLCDHFSHLLFIHLYRVIHISCLLHELSADFPDWVPDSDSRGVRLSTADNTVSSFCKTMLSYWTFYSFFIESQFLWKNFWTFWNIIALPLSGVQFFEMLVTLFSQNLQTLYRDRSFSRLIRPFFQQLLKSNASQRMLWTIIFRCYRHNDHTYLRFPHIHDNSFHLRRPTFLGKALTTYPLGPWNE